MRHSRTYQRVVGVTILLAVGFSLMHWVLPKTWESTAPDGTARGRVPVPTSTNKEAADANASEYVVSIGVDASHLGQDDVVSVDGCPVAYGGESLSILRGFSAPGTYRVEVTAVDVEGVGQSLRSLVVNVAPSDECESRITELLASYRRPGASTADRVDSLFRLADLGGPRVASLVKSILERQVVDDLTDHAIDVARDLQVVEALHALAWWVGEPGTLGLRAFRALEAITGKQMPVTRNRASRLTPAKRAEAWSDWLAIHEGEVRARLGAGS